MNINNTYENYVSVIVGEGITTFPAYFDDCDYDHTIDPESDLYWFSATPFSKEEFEERMKTDEDFSKRWTI